MKIVFTNGCFDLIHPGHVYFLQAAAMLGDVLYVGLNSDASVTRLKGPGRPIYYERHRANMLRELISVSRVYIFDEDTPLKLIRELKPDVLVKGADYQRADVVGGDVVEGYGGRVVLADLVPTYSTTATIAAMKPARTGSKS